MYQNPTLFPAITNRETWLQIIQVADDTTGDLIDLTDFDVALEIMAAAPRAANMSGYGPGDWYDGACEPQISASLADYISVVDTGTLQIQIPKSVITALNAKTYDVFLTITPSGEDDSRQLLIGKLPVLYGGRNT